MDVWAIVLIIVLLLCIIGLVIWHIMSLRMKWKCTDKGCEFVLNGDYNSHPECQKACNADNSDADDEYSSDESEEPVTYMCAANGQCIPTEGSTGVSLEHCVTHCKPPVQTVLVNPYYPQSMFPRYPYHPRRPRRSKSRRSRR